MTAMPARLTVREQMVVVGLVGILLGAFRFHFSLGWFLCGVTTIAMVRATGKLQQVRSPGQPIRNSERNEIIKNSFIVALLLLSAASLPAVILFFTSIAPTPSHGTYLNKNCGNQRVVIPALPVLVALLSGVSISAIMRRLLW